MASPVSVAKIIINLKTLHICRVPVRGYGEKLTK